MTAVQSKPFIWPSNPDFSLPVKLKIKVEALINNRFPIFKSEYESRYKEALTWVKECTVYLDDKGEGVWNTGKMVGEGTDTKVYKGYSPVSGKYYAIKEFSDPIFNKILHVYKALKDKPHCVQLSFQSANKIVEPLYDESLHTVVKSSQLDSTGARISAIFQMATAIFGIHSVQGLIKWNTALSHRDLSHSNVFVKRDANDKLTFDVGDYSRVLMLREAGCFLVQSPEIALLYKDKVDYQIFHVSNGTRIDIWQLGLLISSVMRKTITPFNWMAAVYSRMGEKIPEVELYPIVCSIVGDLKQTDIDKQIAVAVNKIETENYPENEKKALQKIWKMVNKYMLRVELAERMPINYILKKIKKIQRIYDGSTT